MTWCSSHGCLPLHTYDLRTGKGSWSCVSCHRPLTSEEVKALPLSGEQRRLSVIPEEES